MKSLVLKDLYNIGHNVRYMLLRSEERRVGKECRL